MKQALIFAAGLGTRLRPLTNNIPKALVNLNGKPVLQHVIEKLKASGFERIVINVHHFAEKIIDFIKENNNFGLEIIISHEKQELLETGGGLLFAEKHFVKGGAILLHNADIISDIDVSKLYDFHIKNNALATLSVQERESSRKFKIDTQGNLCGWKNFITGEEIISREEEENEYIAFNGVHVVDYKIFDFITEQGKFSITPVYLRLAKEHNIMTLKSHSSYWFDIGKLENLKKAEFYLKNYAT